MDVTFRNGGKHAHFIPNVRTQVFRSLRRNLQQSIRLGTDAQSNEALARYVPITDQLCNYCEDYSASTVQKRIFKTLYTPGIGYPDLFPVSATKSAKLDLGAEQVSETLIKATDLSK